MLASTKAAASASVGAPSANQPIIRSRRASSIGSGEGGEAATSTTPRTTGPEAPAWARAAISVAILPPMLWPTSSASVTARSWNVATTCATIVSHRPSPVASAAPKPGRSSAMPS